MAKPFQLLIPFLTMFDLKKIQTALTEFKLDGWLLYDFRGQNVLAHRVLQVPEETVGSRRFCYFIPAAGPPKKLVHRIESGTLDHLPGEKTIYLRWQEFEQGIAAITDGSSKIAMEYSPRNGNPYISKVDGGTIELVKSCSKEVVSSGDLIQFFEARLTPEQWQLHLQADQFTQKAFELSWDLIRERTHNGGEILETEVQAAIMDHFHAHNLTTYHPPLVGVNENSGDPHYEPVQGQDKPIK
ncbi:MAG: aminopeptidase P family protein, partial [Planctomycetota bacterium]|nr:aminopeptidase P family protein [Planctomycetota bacterium]